MKIICPNCLNSDEIKNIGENGVAVCSKCGTEFRPEKETPLPNKNAPAEPVPRNIGRFPVQRLIGRGGMCCVYEGTHPELNIQVALKVPRAEFAQDPDFCARFRKSAKICAKISHPNIVKMYEYGEDSKMKLPYLVMEYIGGGTLGDMLTTHGCLSAMETIRVAHAICHGLLVAEKNGIVHRDIKPDNIMISNDGQYKLADLGLAKQDIIREESGSAQLSEEEAQFRTNAMYSLGTLEFMPPEQLLNAAACDSRADIYSLGVTMYQLATGHLPLECGENDDFRQLLLTREPYVPGKYDDRLPLLFDYIVMTCIQKTRIYRYQSFRELNADLEAYIDGQRELPSMHVDPPVIDTRPRKSGSLPPGSGRLILIASILLVAILILTMLLAVKLFRDPRKKQPSGILTAPVQHVEIVPEAKRTSGEKQTSGIGFRNAQSATVTVTIQEEDEQKAKTQAFFHDCAGRAEQAMARKDGYLKIIGELQTFAGTGFEADAKELIHRLEVSEEGALHELMLDLDEKAAPFLKDRKWENAIKIYRSNITKLKEESQELREAKIMEIARMKEQDFRDSVIPME